MQKHQTFKGLNIRKRVSHNTHTKGHEFTINCNYHNYVQGEYYRLNRLIFEVAWRNGRARDSGYTGCLNTVSIH